MSLRLLELFGLSVETDFPFGLELAPSEGPPALRIVVGEPTTAPHAGAAIYISPDLDAEGRPLLCVWRHRQRPSVELLDTPEGGRFEVSASEIVWHANRRSDPRAPEAALLGVVFAYWLERRGEIVLHASAVVVAGEVFAFLGASGSGKSSLAVELVAAGHELLTDEVLTLSHRGAQVMARPGVPRLRLWPDSAKRAVGSIDALPAVAPGTEKRYLSVGKRFGRFARRSAPVARIYLPQRKETASSPHAQRLPRRAALVELIRHSYLPRLVEAVGLRDRRFALLAKIVAQVPIERLEVPEGLEHLPAVRDLVLAELSRPVGGGGGVRVRGQGS